MWGRVGRPSILRRANIGIFGREWLGYLVDLSISLLGIIKNEE